MSANFWNSIWLFAQEAAGGGGAGNAGGAGDGGAPAAADKSNPLLSMVFMFGPIVLLFYFLIMRPERRKQADHRSLLEALKKNDRVVTIGGIYGVVANVQREADRVTLKIDEATNTKIEVTFSAIARVLAAEPEAEKK